MNITDRLELEDGRWLPVMGFGCYKSFGEELIQAVDCAIRDGYRYLDTAYFYKNEKDVGMALKKLSIPREKLFIVSKIWPTDFSDPVGALDRSLRNLGLDYLDGYLLHWPGTDESLRNKAFEALLREYDRGRILVPGVSNFLQCHLVELNTHFDLWPQVNQIEVHPFFQQKKLCDFCGDHEIQVISWAPLGRGHEMNSGEILRIAHDLDKTPAQILLRWQIEKKYVPIPKSVHPQRIRENASIFDFTLNAGQMKILDSLNMPDNSGRIGSDPMQFSG